MNKNYNPKDFFRHSSKELLQALFKKYEVMAEFDFSEKSQNKIVENLFKEWQTLDQEIFNRLESDFIEIHNMSNERGFQALVDELNFHGQDLIKTCDEKKIQDIFSKVFWTYLNRESLCDKDFWTNAKHFQKSDAIAKGRWKKRSQLGQNIAQDSDEACKQFASDLSAFLKEKLGKGKNCQVDVLKRERGGKQFIYYFAYPEDFSITSLEYSTKNDNTLKREYRRPAFEIIFLYSQEEESLDIWHDGVGRPIIHDLQSIFCKNILSCEIQKPVKDRPEYALDQLKNRDMIFKIDPTLGISSLAVCSLKLSSGYGCNITIDVNANENKLAIYSLLEKIEGKLDKVFLKVIRASFIATFKKLNPDGKPITITFSISLPNNCKLQHFGEDGAIRQVLLDSGVQINPVVK